jgi:hypothetical protein
LRRRQLQRRDAAQEVLEHLQLCALEGIAEQLGELAHLQPGIFRPPSTDSLPPAREGLTASVAALETVIG